MWILRDLTNGDGADGRPWPTYLWCCDTREQARSIARKHKSRPKKYSRLGPVEHRVDATVRARYELCAIDPGVYYAVRIDRERYRA